MNKDEINEISSKMKTMEEMLKKNVFENPLREVQCSIRNDLIDFKSTLIKNLSELDNYMVRDKSKQETLKTEQTLNNTNGGNCNNESLEQALKEIAKKDYQILHIARSFDLYEKKSVRRG